METVDDGLRRTGACGMFQILMTVCLIAGYMTGELIVQNMAFLELMPQYE